MDNNWIVENLTNAFGVWNSKMTEMWSLLTESPQTFKGGTIWQTIVTINGGMQAIGYGLLVLFFAIGIFRSSSGFRDFQRPEHLLRHFIYFVLAKLGITYGMDLLVDVFDVCSGIVATAAGSIGGLTGASVALPQEIADAIGDVGFLASMDNYREKIVRIVERELKRTEEYQQRRDEYGNEEYILGCIMVKGDAFPKEVIAHAFVEDMGLELQFQIWRDEPRIRQKL